MAAPAVIRVKRSRVETPLEALVVSCKRQKCNEEVPLTTILTFAGTFKTQEENVHSQLTQALGSKGAFKSYVPNVKQKVREQVRSKWQKDRFKVVNFYRFQGEIVKTSESISVISEELTVVDIESSHETPGISDNAGTSSEEYEYDLYYTESAVDLSLGVMDTLLSIHPYELVDDSYRDEELGDDYSDDSNDENNWRNDYPEERSDEEEDEAHQRYKSDDKEDDDLLKQMAECGIEDGEELSDDEDDEALVYGREESPFDAYRRRCMKELGEDESSNNSDSASNEYFSGLDDLTDADSD